MSDHELSVEERFDIQVVLMRGMSQRAIARMLNRSPSPISRESRRKRNAQGEYVTPPWTAREAWTPQSLPAPEKAGAAQ
ncbi:transcriptional regulator [Pseudomonas sp. TCU-HL1]|nr:transcriptional regulator [Pseudomonas sp. TCU-HL1]